MNLSSAAANPNCTSVPGAMQLANGHQIRACAFNERLSGVNAIRKFLEKRALLSGKLPLKGRICSFIVHNSLEQACVCMQHVAVEPFQT